MFLQRNKGLPTFECGLYSNPRETNCLLQRLSVLIQRFNCVLVHESLVPAMKIRTSSRHSISFSSSFLACAPEGK